jgi:hypothetical protein
MGKSIETRSLICISKLQPITKKCSRKVGLDEMPELHVRMPRIVTSQFGEFGGALGAAALAVHQWSPRARSSDRQ